MEAAVLVGNNPLYSQTGGIPSFKNRGRHVPAFPGGAAGSEAMPAPHPIEETTNVPLPGSGALRVSHQSDPGLLAQDCVPKAGDLEQPSQTNDESDQTALVDAWASTVGRS